MVHIMITYTSMLVIIISACFLIRGFAKKNHKMKILSSYILGASLMIFGFMIPNPIFEWIFAIIGLIFLIAPNNMKEIDFNKIG